MGSFDEEKGKEGMSQPTQQHHPQQQHAPQQPGAHAQRPAGDPQPTARHCPACGAPLQTDSAKFCGKCGAALNGSIDGNSAMQQGAKEKFYKKTWFIVLMAFILPPLGIVLAWVYKKPENMALRIAVTVISALLIIGYLGASANVEGSDAESPSAAGQEQEASEEQQQESPVASVSATYSGDTEEGTEISESTSGWEVTITREDGTTEKTHDFTVDNPSSLVAGETTTYSISASGKTTTVDIACSTMSEEQFRESCSAPSYDDLARNPGDYVGGNIVVTGEVMQVQEGTDFNTYIVLIEQDEYGYYNSDSAVLMQLDSSYSGTRILEDDIITVYGTSTDLYTYTTVLGASRTVPSMIGEYVDFN